MKDNLVKNNNKDIMYNFLLEPTRENFATMVFDNTGEQNNIDFKLEWIKPQKIVQIMLGIANVGGGAIVFGIRENSDGSNESIGIESFKDKADVQKEVQKYLPKELKFEIYNFDYSNEVYSKMINKKFQVLFIHTEEKDYPYICPKQGGDLREGDIFIRRGTETVLVNSHELKQLINKKINATYSNVSEIELKEHLTQLEILYSNISKSIEYHSGGIAEMIKNKFDFSYLRGQTEYKINEKYPKEDFEDFIIRMIDQKKIKIEKILDLK